MNPKTFLQSLFTATCSKGPYIYVGVVLCVTLGIMLPLARGEAIHMSRDFGYFSKEELRQATHKSPPIVSDQDAVKFLQHYGYLHCNGSDVKNQARKRRAISDLDITEGGLEENDILDGCSKLDIIHATVMYQDLLKLPITGSLDSATKDYMNLGRCGDSDDELVAIEEKRLSGELPRSSSSRYMPPWMSHQGEYRGKRDLYKKRNIKVGKRSRRSTSSSHKRSVFKHPPLKVYVDEYGSTFGREEGQIHLKHHHPIPEGSIDESHSVLERILMPNQYQLSPRRRQMFQEIKSQYVLNSSNSTKSTDSSLEERTLLKEKPFVNIFPAKKRQKRHSVEKRNTGAAITKFNKEVLIYKLLDGAFSQRIPAIEQCTTISLAFRMWAEVTNIDFRPATSSTPRADIDVVLAFGKEQHLDCNQRFDGQGGEVAHTNKSDGVGRVHFDDDEDWRSDATPGSSQIPFLLAAVHEIGHVLGLSHLDSENSVMYPTIASIQERIPALELTTLDRKAIQYLYGQCTGRFDGAFDWLHTNPNRYSGLNCMQPCQCDAQVWQYFTYFFRERSYWLYLNSQNRPRYGDPLPIKQEWKGLPTKVDGMTQIMLEHTGACLDKTQTTQFEFLTLFFKDNMVYKYDDVNDIVFDSMEISEMYPPAEGQLESVPDNIDAVIFDPRNNHLFFFKDEWIWEVDPFQENTTCCVEKHRFSDLYPSDELTGNVDAGYLRWREKEVYFYKGDNVYSAELWENKVIRGYTAKVWQPDVGPTTLTNIGAWNSRWNDLCDVVTSTYEDCVDM